MVACLHGLFAGFVACIQGCVLTRTNAVLASTRYLYCTQAREPLQLQAGKLLKCYKHATRICAYEEACCC